MATLVFIGAMGFSALIDIVMAVAIMHYTASFFDLSLLWYHYFIIAPLIGALPDLDAFSQLFSEKKIDDAHHSFMHWPPLMIAIGFFGGFLFSPFWGTAIAFSWLAHYVHDSCCLDFGLKWLWPFTNNQYHFFGNKPLGKKSGFRIVHIYVPTELEGLKDQFIELEPWLKEVYYRPTLYSGIELALSSVLFALVAASFMQDLFLPKDNKDSHWLSDLK
ncbi:MAG: metal-dependent hydrolase, partial [Patescibacteria group bacterium]